MLYNHAGKGNGHGMSYARARANVRIMGQRAAGVAASVAGTSDATVTPCP